MTDILDEIDMATRHSTSARAMLLLRCRAEIVKLRPVASPDWQPIETLPFPVDHGTHRRTNHPVWLCNAKGEVKHGSPLRRARDGLIGLFALDYHPTHWQPYTVPAPPPRPEAT